MPKPDLNSEFAIIHIDGDHYQGAEVEEVLTNKRVSLKSELKTKPVWYYYSLHSLREGKEIMKKYEALRADYQAKTVELHEEFIQNINQLMPHENP